MSDWVYDNFGWLLLASGIGLFALLYVALKGCHDERNKLIDECAKAGVARYDCAAKFQHYCKSGGDVYVAPVVIPGRR